MTLYAQKLIFLYNLNFSRKKLSRNVYFGGVTLYYAMIKRSNKVESFEITVLKNQIFSLGARAFPLDMTLPSALFGL